MNRVNTLFWIIDFNNVQNICVFCYCYFTHESRFSDYVYVRNFYKL